MSKKITEALLDFIEWEFEVEITEKIEKRVRLLAAQISQSSISEQEVVENEEEELEEFWNKAYSSTKQEIDVDLFDSYDEDFINED